MDMHFLAKAGRNLGLSSLLALSASPALAQFTTDFKVANYATGKSGTASYEHFSFYVEGGKASDISYEYGEPRKEVRLRNLGKATFKGLTGFKVLFPNKLVLYVIPSGNTLKVYDDKGKYAKTFSWEYAGPVNGRGTWCSQCMPDDKAAMQFLKSYYFK